MAETVFTGDSDELVYQQCPEPDAAEGRIDHPLDAAGQSERTAVAAMQRRVGDDSMAVQRQQRKDLRVIDIAAPALDEGAVLDVVPREPSIGDGQVLEKLIQRVNVLLGEGTEQNSAAVAQDGLLRIAMRHVRTIPSRLRVSASPREKVPLDKLCRVPNPNRPTLDNLPKNSRTPVGTERLAEAALRFFHLLARPRLAEDPHEAGAEA